MKKMILTLMLLNAMFVGPIFGKSAEEHLDNIVAVVNDDVITDTEFNQALTTVKIQFEQSGNAMPEKEVLQKQVLDQLINKKLQLQLAHQSGVNINDKTVNQTIERIAQQNDISVKTLYGKLNEEGIKPDDYRREIREQLTIQKLQQRELTSRVNITENEVNNFMRSAMWQFNSSKEYRLEDILIPLSDAPASEEIVRAKKHAEELIAKLNAGASFRQVAQAESGDKHALQGGDLGWRKLPEIPSAFAELVTQLQKNEISGPIQTPNGFHIIRLAGTRDTNKKQTPPNRKQIEELLMQRKFEEAVQNWMSKIRNQAYIVKNFDQPTLENPIIHA